MASSYSQLHIYSQELYTPNIQLIATVGQAKQGKLDANRAKLDTLYDSLSFLDIAKDGDKEYAENRLQQARSITNQYASGDLSDANMSRQLQQKLRQTIDSTMRTAVLSTKRYRAEQNAWSKLQQDSPDKYSQLNHSYANRASNSWLNDGQTGTKYNGGGGVIEYQDISKKIMDNLPKLQDSLNAEWVQTGPQQGYFRSLDTYEAIDRGAMNKAMNLLFDHKDQSQMNINAWGAFDGASDEDLREAYDGYYAPRLEANQDRLEAIKSALSKATTQDDKDKLGKMIQQVEKDITSLQNNTFENVASSSGREAAYTTLYNSQFRDNILDVYSYGPRLTERKVDVVQKANAEFSLKLSNAAESARHNRVTEEASLVRNQIAAAKANGSYTKPEGVEEGRFVAGGVEIEPEGELDNFVTDVYKERDEAYRGASALFRSEGLDPSLLGSSEFRDALDNIGKTSHITVGGKRIDVKKNFAVLEEFRQMIYKKSVTRENISKSVTGMLKASEKRMRGAARWGSGFDSRGSLPNFNFRLIKGKDGKMKYKYLKYDGKTHNYAYLIKKLGGPKSKEGRDTLDLYMALHLLNDGSLSSAQVRVAKDHLNELLSDLPASVRKHINQDRVTESGSRVKNSHSVVNSVKDFWLSELNAGDLTLRPDKLYKAVKGDPGYLTTRADYWNEEAKDFAEERYGTNKGIDFILSDGFKAINNSLSDIYAATSGQKPSSNKYSYNTDSEFYSKIKVLAGIPEANFKNNITVEQLFNKGRATDMVKVTYRTPNKDADTKVDQPFITHRKPIRKSDLPSGVADLFEIQRVPYDARQGEDARTLDLGTNEYDLTHPVTIKDKRNGTGSPIFNEANILAMSEHLKTYGEHGNRARFALQEFKNNAYSFALVPDPSTGTYSIEIKYGDIVKDLVPTNYQEFTTSQAESLWEDPRDQIEPAFLKYLKTLEQEAAERKALSN